MAEEEIGIEVKDVIVKTKIDNDSGLVYNNIPGIYDHGVFEGSVKRANNLLREMKPIMQKYGVIPQIVRVLKCETLSEKDPYLPAVSASGEEIRLTMLVTPLDKVGNDNRVWIPQETYKDWYGKILEDGRSVTMLPFEVEVEDEDTE